MAWTSPRTWTTSEVVTAAMMNTHVRDNLLEVDPTTHGILRQRVIGTNAIADSTTNTSYEDITNATLSITTTGGRLMIYLIPVDGQDASIYVIENSGTGTAVAAYLKALVGATSLGGIGFTHPNAAAVSYGASTGAALWSYTPSAAAHTVKLQGKVSANYELFITQWKLVAEEWTI